MIITRTPFRISFFGGGTDIPEYFQREGGEVLSTTIDKYCYVTARPLPPFFEHSIRIAYSVLETCKDFDEIKHPLVRVALKDFNRNDVEIHYDADLPGHSGIGSSSSFGVGLAYSLSVLAGKNPSKEELARLVIHYERHVLKEHGGYQDQIAAAYGGLNHVRFFGQQDFSVEKVHISDRVRQEMLSRLLLCYIPKKRLSASVSVAREINNHAYQESLRFIRNCVVQARAILDRGNLDDFGHLLHEAWNRKRSFSGVTDSEIDGWYQKATKAGALGGKLLGAGGGGFMLLWVLPADRERVAQAIAPLLTVPFDFESEGATVIYRADGPAN